ncbi:MAG TPA: histidine phosphatase family protein [Candidatus Paceibacterota bacterium]|nr:histidine phosphatase family protein [Candidatus Paceibacterota bacterium]
MKTVYIVRHGESSSNAGGIILGGDKTPLTEKGREQPLFVGKRLSHLPVELVVASSYLRARQTGDIIAEHLGKPIEYSDLFVEWRQGSHRVGADVADPELLKEMKSLIEHMHDEDRRVIDEENFSDLNERAGQALSFLAERPEEHIVVVSHGWFTPILFGKAIMGEDFTGRDCEHLMKSMRLFNTGLTILTHGDERWWDNWNVVTWNDHAHLG